MSRTLNLTPVFVKNIPKELIQGSLYISVQYGTVIHTCCCGCGNEVVTPLSPTDWELVMDGETVSLDPSIGNWSFDCQSHYWIIRNKVIWAESWSREKIDAGRAFDRLSKAKRYRAREIPTPTPAVNGTRTRSWLQRVWMSMKSLIG